MQIRFDDQVAIVTGAGAGLGRNHALYLASRGAKVVVNDLGTSWLGEGVSRSPAQEVADEIIANGGSAVPNFDSVTDPEGARRMVDDAVRHFGGVDILINNAGILRDKSFIKMSLEAFELVLKVHLMGSVHVTKAAFPIMRENAYGRIVLTTSASGLYGNFGQSNYSAAKMGIVGFMNALKLEGEKYDIKINTIAPLAAMRLTDSSGLLDEKTSQLLDPSRVTPIVAYLCSRECDRTGDILSVGGGVVAGVQTMEARGVCFDHGEEITPEKIAARYDDIVDMRDAKGYGSLIEQIADRLAL
jgi:NAD(P)-dependent dehydrogenase (short-subunit alcohol dehydrogenase family)